MNSAIEAFEREFAPWALKLPAADVAARRNGQLRVNGWSVLYEFGSDAYGEYLDYYAALRGATDARVHDDWHARIYETGQVVAFPAVLEAYLYGRDPSQEELDRARAPVLESLAPAPEADESTEESTAAIGTADTALWEDLREVVEAEVASVAPPPGPAPAPVSEPAKAELPRRPSAETPAEIESVLDAAFGVKRPASDQAAIEREPAAAPVQRKAPEAPKRAAPASAAPKPPEQPKAAEPVVAKEPEADEPVADEPVEHVAPRRSVPGYDPFVELRTLEPKSSRRAAPTGDDFRPYWQRYPGRAAGVAAAVAAVLLITILLMGHGGSKSARTVAADSAASNPAAPAATTDSASGSSASAANPDSQAVATPEDATDTGPVPAGTSAGTAAPSSPSESSVARPVGPGSIAPIVRTDGSAANPSASHRFARPTGS